MPHVTQCLQVHGGFEGVCHLQGLSCPLPRMSWTPRDLRSCRYMADAVIAFLQDEMARLLADPVSQQELASTVRPLQPPMLPNNSEYLSGCLNGTSLSAAVVSNKVGSLHSSGWASLMW